MKSRKTAPRQRNRTKQMGQNFLTSRTVAERIVGSLGDISGCHVLEIGPGRGALTGLLAGRAGRLTALELDSHLAEALAGEYAGRDTVRILRQDALKYDIAAWASSCGDLTPVVAGNIPYSITNDLLHQLLHCHEPLGVVVLMVQQEVARKITAAPGGKPYGMISVLCAYHASLEYLFTVPRGNFVPSPAVDSAVIRLDFKRPSPFRAADYARFDYLVRRLFEERRKQIQKVLRKGSRFELSAEDIGRIAVASGVELSRRPEELSVREFVALAEVLRDYERIA